MPQIGETKRGREINKTPTHKFAWHACETCGKEQWVRLTRGQPISLRCRICAVINSRWRGGRYRGKQGYVYIRLQPGDFFYPMMNRSGYVFEHRIVMARHLKRCLLPWELVHHKNHVRDDNRIENLELISHRRYHLVDTQARAYIKRLERRIRQLEKRVGEQTIEISELKSPYCKWTERAINVPGKS